MSIWTTLAGIGSIAAAPFTGGTSLAWLPGVLGAAGQVGSMLGKQQQGRAQGAAAQAQLQQGQDRNAVDLYQARQNAQDKAGQLDLERQQFGIGSRGQNARQALIGALLGGGVTPTSIGGGQVSGGLLRSLNANPDALAAMKTLSSQASTAQNTPLSFTGGSIMPPPTLTPLPNVGGHGALSTLAMLGQMAGAVSPYIKIKPKEPDYSQPPSDQGAND